MTQHGQSRHAEDAAAAAWNEAASRAEWTNSDADWIEANRLYGIYQKARAWRR